MKTRRNRSPALAGVVTAVVGMLIASSAPAAAAAPAVEAPPEPPASRELMTGPLGTSVAATLTSEKEAAASCRRGKRLVATSSGYVTRAVVKAVRVSCYSCCEGSIFFDDFETGDTTNWSGSSGT